MKLATALSQRAALQTKLSELSTRLNNNAKTQEGEKPAEDPEELLQQTDRILVQLEDLIARINLRNSRTVDGGVTLTELLAKRDVLSKRLSVMRSFLDSSSEKVTRYAKTEIKIVSTVDVAKLQKQTDALSADLRALDERIQTLNWTVDL
ncbi:MAG: DIP1984 family protein [Clostridia bacterium]|nr:DIP1984 family protein [Clostridia bacterium]